MAVLPKLYFRLRDNGAQVFRVELDDRQQRMDLKPLAHANVRNGTIRPHGQQTPTDTEQAEIRAWLAARADDLARLEAGTPDDTIAALNRAAHWAQSGADDDQVEAAADALLMAMHDLRSVLIRRRANRLMRAEGEATGDDN